MRKSFPRFLPWLVAISAILSILLIHWSRRVAGPWENAQPTPSPASAVVPGADAVAATGTSGAVATVPGATPGAAIPPAATGTTAEPVAPTPIPTPAAAAAGGEPAASGTNGAPKPAEPDTAAPTPAKTPEPTPTPTPTPTPAPLTIAVIAAQPQLWPAQVALSIPVQFPISINGAQAGSIQLPRNTVLTLRRVNVDETVDVLHQGALARIPGSSTTLLAQVSTKQNSVVPPAPAAGGEAAAQPAPAANGAATGAAVPGQAALAVTVTRDRSQDVGADEQGRRLWVFHVLIKNASDKAYPKVAVRFFAFSRAGNELSLAANDTQSCDVPANGEITVDPAKLRLENNRTFDGYAVLLRDADNAIVGSSTTRESVTKNWTVLESLPPGSPVP